MNRMIITVFNTEEQAFEGLSALKTLHQNGDITLYATAVINKDEKGEVKLKTSDDTGPVGMGIGMLTGSLIGMIGGPAGMAVGAMAGTVGGMFYDIDKRGLDTEIVEEISNHLQAGKTAVIVDADEGWTAPVDTRMDELNAMVFRRNRAELEDEQLKREADALNAEIEELEADFEEASDEMKASIKKQIDKSKSKAKVLKETIDKKMEETKSENKAKKEKINKQLEDASSRKKKKLEKRKAKLKSNYDKQVENLSAAGKKLSQYIS